jgi:hypothetical protein
MLRPGGLPGPAASSLLQMGFRACLGELCCFPFVHMHQVGSFLFLVLVVSGIRALSFLHHTAGHLYLYNM